MKKTLFIVVFLTTFLSYTQQNNNLQSHYEAFYKQMKVQGDYNGIVSALTHLNILAPSQQRKDTLAFLYMQNNQHVQALNTIGVEIDAADSDLAVKIKAVSLKAINQPQRAIEQFESLFKRAPSAYIAYELADLKIQVNDNDGANTNIEFGIENSKDDMRYPFYERQQPYEVPLKAAFLHLKGLVHFNKNKDDIDTAITYIDQALKIDSNFNLASLSKQALESRKNESKSE